MINLSVDSQAKVSLSLSSPGGIFRGESLGQRRRGCACVCEAAAAVTATLLSDDLSCTHPPDPLFLPSFVLLLFIYLSFSLPSFYLSLDPLLPFSFSLSLSTPSLTFFFLSVSLYALS